MIIYSSGYFGFQLLWRCHGSAVFKSLTPAAISTIIYLLITYVSQLDPEPDNGEKPVLLHPYPMGALVSALVFLLTFRANFSYNRYWEAISAVHTMHSKWIDVGVEVTAFHLQSTCYEPHKPISYGKMAKAESEMSVSATTSSSSTTTTTAAAAGGGSPSTSAKAKSQNWLKIKSHVHSFHSINFLTRTRKARRNSEILSKEDYEKHLRKILMYEADPSQNRSIDVDKNKNKNSEGIENTSSGNGSGKSNNWKTKWNNRLRKQPNQTTSSTPLPPVPEDNTVTHPKMSKHGREHLYAAEPQLIKKSIGSSGNYVNPEESFGDDDITNPHKAWTKDRPPLFLKELAHLLSLLSAVALSELRNDIEGSESPLITFTPGVAWPPVDPDSFNADIRVGWEGAGGKIANVWALCKYSLNISRTPEARTLYNAARPFKVIGGVSDAEIELLQCPRGSLAKVALVLLWVQEFITREHLTGSTGAIAPPIVARVYQFLSDGLTAYYNASKISFIPFPFPHSQITALFTLFVIGLLPIVMATYISNVGFGLVMNFLTVMCFTGLHEVARELESPFLNVPNEIPLNNFQAQYNESLMTLFAGYHPDSHWDHNDVLLSSSGKAATTRAERPQI